MENVVAKKQFGQNFLKDDGVLHKIIQSMPKNNNKIVEIGPGLGDLTKYLVDIKSVEAFEVDTDLCQYLNKTFEKEINTKRFTLNCGDVLEAWKSELVDYEYDMVANLPYYIATNIILKALADTNCKNIMVMVQLEVAQKFAALVGEKVFSSLGVITQSVGEASIVVKVPPESFDPAPKVDSAVLFIQKSSNRDDKGFEEFLKLSFTQPRKTFAKNLSSEYDKSLVLEILENLELKPTIRPHEISTPLYQQIYKKLQK